MGVRLRRATSQQLADLLEACRADTFTYAPAGGSINGTTPSGLHRHHWATALRGPESFDRGVEAIRTWAVHRGAGLEVATDGPIAVGTNVAICAPLPVGFVDATCRIAAVVDEHARYGFAYGTLSVHPERGEEAFLVVRDDDGNGALRRRGRIPADSSGRSPRSSRRRPASRHGRAPLRGGHGACRQHVEIRTDPPVCDLAADGAATWTSCKDTAPVHVPLRLELGASPWSRRRSR